MFDLTRARSDAFIVMVLVAGAACSTSSTPPPQPPTPTPLSSSAAQTWSRAQHVFDTRCVVCHGCFDAPCQLKLDSWAGISRGANATRVYEPRQWAMAPTRLFVDAHDVAGWRAKGFHPVVPEGDAGDLDRSVMLRLLALKRAHPLTKDVDVAAAFTLELGRKQVCVKDNDVDGYAKEHPLWGMPYGLPGLNDDDNDAIVAWISAGMPHAEDAVSPVLQARVNAWEAFFNDDTLRGRLVARYLFEHLYFASLYLPEGAPGGKEFPEGAPGGKEFPEGAPGGKELPDGAAGENDVDGATFFVLVRSTTPPGVAVDEIATRRPFDDPGVDRVYYRLVHRERLPLDKTHMPYALSDARRARFTQLFFNDSVVVTGLPGYEEKLAANPFRVFAALPVDARYRFLLDDAQYTLMGFVKGPVCRGNVALNVINDRFWVAFIDPDSAWMAAEARLLNEHADLLDLPAEGGSNAPWLQWLHYGEHMSRYLDLKAASLPRLAMKGDAVDTSPIWNGDGKNDNAALTVFRHEDHGSVVKGFVGAAPDSGFVMDYAVLERISYLLVSGFDVFGSVSHQLQTRLYMDFLRLESEANFLAFQPPHQRVGLVHRWYRGLGPIKAGAIDAFFAHDVDIAAGLGPDATTTTCVKCVADFSGLERRVASVASHRFDPAHENDGAVRDALMRIGAVTGVHATQMPELSFVEVTGGADAASSWFTIIRNTAHTNVASMFDEEKRFAPGEDSLTGVPGLIGSYPSALFSVSRTDLAAFSAAVVAVDGATAYAALRERWGVRRNDPQFWARSDELRAAAHALDPVGSGTFDFGRLDP